MAAYKRRPIRDPKLEALRATGLREHAPPDINPVYEDLMDKTRRIHAGFLFDAKYGGCETWRLLMSHLCATSGTAGNILADWKAFCNLLGFDRPIIQSIENVQPGCEDPVTNTLRAFCQRRDATLSQVVSALKQMEREDILLIVSHSMMDLADGVLRDHEELGNTNMDSGYLSRDSQDQDEPVTIIIPQYIPSVPCLLKDKTQLSDAFVKIESSKALNITSNNTNLPITTTNIGPTHDLPIENTNYVHASPENNINITPSPPRQDLNCVVMLTFAMDGQESATELARILREPRENDKKCGVLVLQEQLAALNRDPIAFVGGCFRKVDYVIPILTPGYLRAIKADSNIDRSTTCEDANYVRYIYRMILDEFTHNNCLNYRVRSIIPDQHIKYINNNITALPVFHAYKRLSESHNFARVIIKKNI